MLAMFICCSVQGSGVGGLTHNTVMLGWPHGWRHSEDEKSYKVFLGKQCRLDLRLSSLGYVEIFVYSMCASALELKALLLFSSPMWKNGTGG